jgi:hypothetical protein
MRQNSKILRKKNTTGFNMSVNFANEDTKIECRSINPFMISWADYRNTLPNVSKIVQV